MMGNSLNMDATDGLCATAGNDHEIDFGNVILEHLRTTGVQQAHKDRIKFTSINPFQENLLVMGGI